MVIREIPVGNCISLRQLRIMNMKLLAASVLGVASGLHATAQTLEKMNWFNEPTGLSIDGSRVTTGEYRITVSPSTTRRSIMQNTAANSKQR